MPGRPDRPAHRPAVARAVLPDVGGETAALFARYGLAPPAAWAAIAGQAVRIVEPDRTVKRRAHPARAIRSRVAFRAALPAPRRPWGS